MPLGHHRVQTQEPEPISDTTSPGERGRFSLQRKTVAVLRLLRGEDLELVSRELGVTAATLSGGVTTSWPTAKLPGGCLTDDST
jgi:hypothetical protein